MNCDWVQENICLYLYKELADDERHELEQHLRRCEVDDAYAVVAELSNKQPLTFQIDAEMVDPADHLAERDLGLQHQRRARALRRAQGGQH